MNKEIIIVTALFNIGRENMKHFERTSGTYVDYFKKWARLKNKMVIFVDSEDVKREIIEFRDNLGLLNSTKVIFIQDVSLIAPEMLNDIKTALSNQIFVNYRLRPTNPESYNPMYNYVMALKAWCIDYTANQLGFEGQLAWVDFGFNHGGKVYTLDSNFDIEWSYDFGDKVTIFNIKPLDDRPIFDIVFSMDTYIMGSMLIVPSDLAGDLWDLTKRNTKLMSTLGISDDDQVLWLLNSRTNAELFSIKKVKGWHTALKEYGCNDLKYSAPRNEIFLKKYFRKIRYLCECLKYANRIFSIACKWKQS